jgi:hypothetical protein
MSEPVRFAQALLGSMPSTSRSGRPDDTGVLDEVDMALHPVTGAVLGASRVVVRFQAGLLSCRWTDSFDAAVRADPLAFAAGGQRVLCEVVGATPTVIGTIHSESGSVGDGL